LIVGYAKVSRTEQNLGLRHDELKPARNASVDPTEARCAAGSARAIAGKGGWNLFRFFR
jgi:hypothetical protein